MAIEKNFELYTYPYLLNQALGWVSDDLDKREGSIIYDTLAPMCQELAYAYKDLNYAVSQCFGTQAIGTNLDELCASLGISRIAGVPPKVYFIFKDSTNTVINNASWVGKSFYIRMTDSINWNFTIISKTTLTGGEGYLCQSDRIGTFQDLIASKADNKIYSDEIGGIASYTNVTDQPICNKGRYVETDEELRVRYLKYLCYNRFGGNFTDYTLLPEIASSLASGTTEVLGVTYNYEYVLGIVRGSLGSVYMWVVKKLTDDAGNVSFDTISTQESNAIKQELDPTTSSGEGNGLLPIGHILTVARMQPVTTSIAYTVTSNTIAKETIKAELEEVARQYNLEKNLNELYTRNANGGYAPYLFTYSDVLTIWGKAYREGYGTLSAATGTCGGTTVNALNTSKSINRGTSYFNYYGTYTITVS